MKPTKPTKTETKAATAAQAPSKKAVTPKGRITREDIEGSMENWRRAADMAVSKTVFWITHAEHVDSTVNKNGSIKFWAYDKEDTEFTFLMPANEYRMKFSDYFNQEGDQERIGPYRIFTGRAKTANSLPPLIFEKVKAADPRDVAPEETEGDLF